jgi:DUF1009 family protein
MTQKIGILAGGGKLPALLIEHCLANQKDFHVLTFKGQEEPETAIPKEHHTLCPPGALGKMLQVLKENSVTDVTMAGAINRPSIFDLRPDTTTIKFFAGLKNKHDNALLTHLCHFWEGEGFQVLGAHEVLPSIITPQGNLTKTFPSKEQEKDIRLAIDAVKTLGKLDIGQSVIVKNGIILGVEAVEGTNALIERCANLRGKKNKGGILVKMSKPQQNLKVDMPASGLNTVQLLAEHQYEGLVLEANKSLMIDKQEMIQTADKAKIFIQGISA